MPWPSVRFAILGMQIFVGIEFDEDDVEDVVVEFGKMDFKVDDVALFVIILEIALEVEVFGSRVENEEEDDKAKDVDED
jgi:hypothetical protein